MKASRKVARSVARLYEARAPFRGSDVGKEVKVPLVKKMRARRKP